ncbi:hypothetical protein [Amycolatopsis nalaikhensis]|uniref:Restriction endonuclease type IV Mrr domain-containing protein n=1 Tax=Amycolatopsis nalaikhensis TaxID=715472 RepID=A0ABY8XYS3_9PSEU|nr:hypothetical protein [Amycolatopsis sp. 2-2]WIV60737.1 hypothetical protein QP939_20040 [Amycolatopsis sp. 2-2]
MFAQVSFRVFYTTDGITTPAAEQIKAGLRAELGKVEQYLEFARGDIRAHQEEIEATVPGLVADRRAQLLSDRQLNASIGFPVKHRGDADTYKIPIRRTRLAVHAAPKTPERRFTPEPALADDDYEAALAVLCNARNAFERTPSMTATLYEEQIRDLLLLLLNAQFEGAAAGEVFNRAGKTDILIRVDDRNVFIGECKFYDGPEVVASALDQLLGYLAWRDTKAALLLFIRDSDVTTVTAKAVQKIKEHPNHKRAGAIQTEDRIDFVLHANGDGAREIRLALLPVLVGGTKRRTSSRLRRALEVPGTVLGSGAQPPAASR